MKYVNLFSVIRGEVQSMTNGIDINADAVYLVKIIDTFKVSSITVICKYIENSALQLSIRVQYKYRIMAVLKIETIHYQ
jgi:hypothetical protein